MLAVVCTLLAGSYQSQAAPGERYFPETGHAIKGAFQSYWEQHGGLERFGYPLSDEFAEVSALNGQTYTVQYFERTEFEHHPENAAPYDVLLTQLGTMRYKQEYATPPTDEHPSSNNPQLFPATGKYVGSTMFAAWQRLGGLMQIGYPVSNEFTERSILDGRSYTVQYFERAELEYHNEQQPSVLMLTQLGRFRYNEHYVAQGNNPYLLADKQAGLYNVVASGDYIFWTGKSPTGNTGVNGYNIATRQQFLINNLNFMIVGLLTDGKQVIWHEIYSKNAEVIDYDLSTGTKGAMLSTVETLGMPRTRINSYTLDNGILYYEEYDEVYSGIYALDTVTGRGRKVRDTGHRPIAGGGRLLVVEDTSGASSLHLLNSDGSGDTTLASDPNTRYPEYAVSGRYAVWLAITTPTPNTASKPVVTLNLYDMSKGASKVIATEDASSLQISGDKVFWAAVPDSIGGAAGYSIRSYDVGHGATSTIVDETSEQLQIAGIVVGDNLVFRAGNSIYVSSPSQQGLQPGSPPQPATSPGTANPHLFAQQVYEYKGCGDYLLWQGLNSEGSNIYGYQDVSPIIYAYDTNKQSVFVVTDKPSQGIISCDDKTLLLGENQGSKLHIYDFTTRLDYSIDLTDTNASGYIIGDGVLYYKKIVPNHSYIYARNLASQQIRQLADKGQVDVGNLTYGHGTLMWDEIQTRYSLHVLKVDGSLGDTIIAESDSFFYYHNVWGDYATWSAPSFVVGQGLFLHRISTDTTVHLSDDTTIGDVRGDLVSWGEKYTTIKLYNVSTGQAMTFLVGVYLIGPVYLIGENKIAFTVSNYHGTSLYLATLK